MGTEVVWAGIFGLGGPEVIIVLILLYLCATTEQLRNIALGVVLGGIIGFLFRPSVPLIGQLPFSTVITRGSELDGIEVLLRSAAVESFNSVMIGAVIGGVLAIGVSRFRSQAAASFRSTDPASATPPAEVMPSRNAFCTRCGVSLTAAVEFCGACGTRRG
jgi:hypothetical protein